MWGTTLPDVPSSFILTSQTIILIVHICLVQAIRLPRAQAERAKVYFYRAVEVWVTGALPSSRAGGRLPRQQREERMWAGRGWRRAWGTWGELQRLWIRKVRISEFLLHFCFQMCHFQSTPLMHMCFWLRTGTPVWPRSWALTSVPFPKEQWNPESPGGRGHRTSQALVLIFPQSSPPPTHISSVKEQRSWHPGY